jgi:hypothetical protein
MFQRSLPLAAAVLVAWVSHGRAQTVSPSTEPAWRPPGGAERYDAASTADDRSPEGIGQETTQQTVRRQTAEQAPETQLAPVHVAQAPQRARVTKGSGTLPNDHGQVWREYDISPYTTRVTTTARPEQAVVDWVLRETGYEAWHGEPLGILSAGQHTLRVYHTPEMQAIVGDIVDRFVNSEAETHAFSLRIVTIENPNWRARALRLMTPIPVQSPGVQGWLLAKEDAALLISELRRRTDYREHNAPNLLVHNGQATVISSMRPRTYTKGIIPTANIWPGYQPEMGVLDEGFSLEFSPLVSLDGGTVDAIVKLRLNQIEKMVPVILEVPTDAVSPASQAQVEVPQLTMCNLHERFRWPVDKVLLLSMGVVATPAPGKDNLITTAIPMLKTPPRADAILLVESKGTIAHAPPTAEAGPATATRPTQTYLGRY